MSSQSVGELASSDLGAIIGSVSAHLGSGTTWVLDDAPAPNGEVLRQVALQCQPEAGLVEPTGVNTATS